MNRNSLPILRHIFLHFIYTAKFFVDCTPVKISVETEHVHKKICFIIKKSISLLKQHNVLIILF